MRAEWRLAIRRDRVASADGDATTREGRWGPGGLNGRTGSSSTSHTPRSIAWPASSAFWACTDERKQVTCGMAHLEKLRLALPWFVTEFRGLRNRGGAGDAPRVGHWLDATALSASITLPTS